MPSRAPLPFPLRAAAPLAAALFLGACRSQPIRETTLADGVVLREDTLAKVQLLLVDRTRAPYRAKVVARSVTQVRNNRVGDALTVREWAERDGVLAAINGGFFGESYDTQGRRKQLVQLAVVDGSVVAPGTLLQRDSQRFARSVLGFAADGAPEICWATGSEAEKLRRYNGPRALTDSTLWFPPPDSAVAGGPRLIHNGRVFVTDREESRLDPEPAARLAVGYSGTQLVFCRAESMTYAALASYLQQTLPLDEALCLDGGPSAQLVVKENTGWRELAPAGVPVPTAIVLVPSDPASQSPPAYSGDRKGPASSP